MRIALNDAILGDGSGVRQLMYSRPKDEAFRQAAAGQVVPGGQAMARRPGQTGTTYSKNLLGDTPTRTLASPPSYDPLHVSINPLDNPQIAYLLDVIAEAVAYSHQEWQDRQRVRGQVDHKLRVVELITTLPFQTENTLDDMADVGMRGDVIDTTQRDFTPHCNPRALAIKMVKSGFAQVVEAESRLAGLVGAEAAAYKARLTGTIAQAKADAKSKLASIPAKANAQMRAFQGQVAQMRQQAQAKVTQAVGQAKAAAGQAQGAVAQARSKAGQILGEIHGDVDKFAAVVKGKLGSFMPQGPQGLGCQIETAWSQAVSGAKAQAEALVGSAPTPAAAPTPAPVLPAAVPSGLETLPKRAPLPEFVPTSPQVDVAHNAWSAADMERANNIGTPGKPKFTAEAIASERAKESAGDRSGYVKPKPKRPWIGW